MTIQGTADAQDSTQEPTELQLDTTEQAAQGPGAQAGSSSDAAGLSDRQRQVLFRLLRVAYPHDRFPDGPYARTATQVEAAAAAGAGGLSALADGLDGLDGLDGGFLDLDEAAATAELQKIDRQPFFLQIHSTTVVALYDDREVWALLGYEGASFDQGGYLDRGFDDLDWLPDARITELDEPRTELVPDPSTTSGGAS